MWAVRFCFFIYFFLRKLPVASVCNPICRYIQMLVDAIPLPISKVPKIPTPVENPPKTHSHSWCHLNSHTFSPFYGNIILFILNVWPRRKKNNQKYFQSKQSHEKRGRARLKGLCNFLKIVWCMDRFFCVFFSLSLQLDSWIGNRGRTEDWEKLHGLKCLIQTVERGVWIEGLQH